MKVVADTNVFISAFLWKGRLLPIYQAIKTKRITPRFIELTWQELVVAISYPKFAKQLEKQSLTTKEVLAFIERLSEFYPDPPAIPSIIKDDPSDNAILASAFVAEVSFIVSGDEHLLNVKDFPVPIVSPREFIEQVL